ncbi:MAG: DUF695 domain-containing protein [Bacteroidetes bacterium]|nr:DUF695 domain-containing protein [Bacteroidota bacterium]
MEPVWEYYDAEIDGEPAVMHVDVRLADRAPVNELPMLVWVQVVLPDEDALPRKARQEWLDLLEHSLAQYLAGRMQALLVGYVVWNQKAEFYFYTPSSQHLDTAVHAVMSRFATTEYSYGGRSDAAWELYVHVLYPNAYELLCIRNRHLLELLRQQGDTLHGERLLDHWFYFADEARGRHLLETLEEEGFSLGEFRKEDEYPDQPWMLSVHRAEVMELEHLNELVGDLLDLAEEFQGTYDGWETEVQPGGQFR